MLLLLGIYISIWDRQNLAGWTQFNIFVAVFFVFSMEGIRTLVDLNSLEIQASFSCVLIGKLKIDNKNFQPAQKLRAES